VTTLVDILVKREYLYRQLFESLNKTINLPLFFTAAPTHPLINELQATFLFCDPLKEEFHTFPYRNIFWVQPAMDHFFNTFNVNAL
jgi:hypothetical protein